MSRVENNFSYQKCGTINVSIYFLILFKRFFNSRRSKALAFALICFINLDKDWNMRSFPNHCPRPPNSDHYKRLFVITNNITVRYYIIIRIIISIEYLTVILFVKRNNFYDSQSSADTANGWGTTSCTRPCPKKGL